MESTTATVTATATQHEQWMVEGQCYHIYELFSNLPRNAQSVMLEIQRDNHIEYLTRGYNQLPASFCSLDANRPWLCYWILHSIALLDDPIGAELESRAIDFLSRCQDPNGGYGGGPGQMPHLATTYAAVNSLITLGGHRSLSSINRDNIYKFLLRMKDRNSGYRMHDGGEMDVRACYTAISVASILNILDHELVRNVGNYILSCQTYEGGIAGEPGSEAHGGYTYCGLATMILIGEVHHLDLSSLIDWLVFRQGRECGFQGRTNKLVDGCYSFWQGGTFALLQRLESTVNVQFMSSTGGDFTKDRMDAAALTGSVTRERSLDGAARPVEKSPQSVNEGSVTISNVVDYSRIGFDYLERKAELEPLFHSMALQQYILLCSQVQEGGFRDKPGKSRDYYHTCYCLSGLSVSQYSSSKDADSLPSQKAVHGPYSNLLESIHPLYNVVMDKYHEAHNFFSQS